MSLFKPQYTWIATGSKSGLKYEFLKPIKDFKIIAFPDKSEYSEWLNKANELNGFGFKIVVNDWLELQSKYGTGTDLADVYINESKEAERVEVVYSETEQKINEIAENTPEIWELIKTFDLVDNDYNKIKKIQ